MISAQEIGYAVKLPPEGAIAFLSGKQAKVTGPWTEWLDGQHARGFTVANVTKLDVLEDIQRSLKTALEKGQTLQQWKDALVPELQRKGWMGRDLTTEQLRQAGRLDEATGEIAKGLTPRRLQTIFSTNMQSAYQAGRYAEMIEQAEERPWWQYVAILDARTRPGHRVMNGRTFRYDDAGWRSFYPPCGFNCRCRVRTFSQAEVTRRQIPTSSTEGKLSQVEVPLRNGAVATVTRYTDRSLAGGSFQPDAGFGRNPALATWQPRLEARDVQLSRRYLDTAMQGPAFSRLVSGADQGQAPVAVLTEARRAALMADNGVAYLDAAAVARQRIAHPDVGLDDYRRIPEIVDQGTIDQAGEATTITWRADGMAWRLALDLAADGVLQVRELVRLLP